MHWCRNLWWGLHDLIPTFSYVWQYEHACKTLDKCIDLESIYLGNEPVSADKIHILSRILFESLKALPLHRKQSVLRQITPQNCSSFIDCLLILVSRRHERYKTKCICKTGSVIWKKEVWEMRSYCEAHEPASNASNFSIFYGHFSANIPDTLVSSYVG